MILLSLSIFLQYDLLQCVVFENADFNGLLRAHNQNSSLRNNTQAVYQLSPITPEYAFFTPQNNFHLSPTAKEIPLETRRSQNIQDDTQNEICKFDFEEFFFRHHRTTKKHQGFTVLDTSKKSEETQEIQEKGSEFSSRARDTSKRSSAESEQEEFTYITLNQKSENSYQRSEDKASDSGESNQESSKESEFFTTRNIQTPLPAMLRTRHTEKTTVKKWRLKPNLLLPVTKIDDRNAGNDNDDKKITPEKSQQEWNLDVKNVGKKKKPRKNKHKGIFGDDKDLFRMMKPGKDKLESVFRMHVMPKTTNKMWFSDRIKVKSEEIRPLITPDDKNADIFKKKTPLKSKPKWNFDGNDMFKTRKPRKHKHKGIFGNDKDIFKMMRPRNVKHKNALRMHVISKPTKKMWYSDRMEMDPKIRTKHTKTLMPAATRQPLRHTTNNDWSHYDESKQEQDTTRHVTTTRSSLEYLRAPLSKNHFFKMIERRQEGYMIVFLIELMQIIATKDKKSVHDVVKHADPIIHRQRKQLLWLGQPLLEITQQLATMLKVTDITVIQAEATNIYSMLLKRHENLPVVTNTILEYAETMYGDDEGKVLFDTLTDFVAFPNIPLSGYWLCNSLINAFLRPFRRLRDTQQLAELVDSVNLAFSSQQYPLRSDQQAPHNSYRGLGTQTDGPAVDNHPLPQKDSIIQIGPQTNTHRPLRKRKRKHHYKRKRDKKQHVLRQWLRQRHHRLSLSSVTPRTTSQFWF